jgi:WD40 repeat protein
MKNRMLVTCILLLTILTGCAPQAVVSETTVTPAPSGTSPAQAPTTTRTPRPTRTPTPTPTHAIQATRMPRPVNEPGLIVTIDDSSSSGSPLPIFSPDGRVLALVGSSIRFWDIQTQQFIRELKNPFLQGCYFLDAKFSPDGHLFAVSNAQCEQMGSNTGHLLVWDFATGDLLQDWEQENARMPAANTYMDEYVIPVYSLAFLPNSTTLVFSSGNSLEIRDVFQKDKLDELKLGAKMFASQISISQDGRLAYIVMTWAKDHDWPSDWTEQQKVQIWNINTHAMLREIKYPEGWATMDLTLLGDLLVDVEFEKGTSHILNLKTDITETIPFRKGWRYYNADASLMIYARLMMFDDKDQSIELWRTDDWRNIYTFMPDFGPDWIYRMDKIVFSPDNTILAIQHGGQVSLWNIRPFVHP